MAKLIGFGLTDDSGASSVDEVSLIYDLRANCVIKAYCCNMVTLMRAYAALL